MNYSLWAKVKVFDPACSKRREDHPLKKEKRRGLSKRFKVNCLLQEPPFRLSSASSSIVQLHDDFFLRHSPPFPACWHRKSIKKSIKSWGVLRKGERRKGHYLMSLVFGCPWVWLCLVQGWFNTLTIVCFQENRKGTIKSESLLYHIKLFHALILKMDNFNKAQRLQQGLIGLR